VEDAAKANLTWATCAVQVVTGLNFLGTLHPSSALVPAQEGAASSGDGAAPSVEGGDAEAAAGAARRRPKGKSSAKAAAERAATKVEKAYLHCVRIPVLINPAPLKEGEELLVHRPRAPKRTKILEAISVAKLAKKAMQS